jgi:hypothetical protein
MCHTQYRSAEYAKHLYHLNLQALPQLVVPAVLGCLFLQADFRKAKEKVLYKKKEGVPEGLYM